ncbi:MAG: DUF1553 domain-containing protein [Armatimonadetes bacterium]|nr:DUF1553 domain-containing protein [Armatimonadota bacterium]
MRAFLLLGALVAAALHVPLDAQAQPVRPFESDTWATPENGVDIRVFAALRERGIEPARPCSDEVFIRRVYLDVIGTLPEPAEVQQFLQDTSPDKRARLIDALFEREEFADYWALKWCDLLRVKAEFPVNLWPNAVQAYHRWLRDAVKDNLPYDRFVRELLTSSGSNFRVPPVNFYRAVQSRDAAGIAEVVALTLMGVRVAKWPQERRDNLAAFFSRVAYKKTDEWKEEVVYSDPFASDTFEAVFPDGATVTIGPGEDPRFAFADWLITPDNPWFTRNIVNRVWAWLMGRGIIHEPDDIRPDNPPVNPELLAWLQDELVAAHYDLRHIYRLILNSRTYQQSSIPRGDPAQATVMFACYPVRRLDAEVLIDALDWIGEARENYSSAIPEPFTFVPEDKRTITLADGSITSSFLQMFGRPPRDTGMESERSNNITDAQRLYLLNSTDVYRRIAGSIRLRRIAIAAGSDRSELIRQMYLTILSRNPTPEEEAAAQTYWQTPGVGSNDAAIDLAWALINTMEFLYRH